MDFTQKLLKLDAAKLAERETKEIRSKRLELLFGEEDVSITIQALNSKELKQVNEYSTDKNGDLVARKLFDTNFMVCSFGIKEPNVKDEELQKHFGATNARELCEKLFDAECAKIANEIMTLSGVRDDAEDEVKN